MSPQLLCDISGAHVCPGPAVRHLVRAVVAPRLRRITPRLRDLRPPVHDTTDKQPSRWHQHVVPVRDLDQGAGVRKVDVMAAIRTELDVALDGVQLQTEQDA